MRIPESLRAMGTDGFKISSLDQTIAQAKNQISSPKIKSNRGGRFAHQILMMSSLSSRLRLIFEWRVAAILQGGNQARSGYPTKAAKGRAFGANRAQISEKIRERKHMATRRRRGERN